MTNIELDEMVAEKVMGWEIEQNPYAYWLKRRKELHHPIPDYSQKISAAWEVVETMKSRGSYVNITWLDNVETDGGGVGWLVACGTREKFATTAPMAICLAALAAVGVNVEGVKE